MDNDKKVSLVDVEEVNGAAQFNSFEIFPSKQLKRRNFWNLTSSRRNYQEEERFTGVVTSEQERLHSKRKEKYFKENMWRLVNFHRAPFNGQTRTARTPAAPYRIPSTPNRCLFGKRRWTTRSDSSDCAFSSSRATGETKLDDKPSQTGF